MGCRGRPGGGRPGAHSETPFSCFGAGGGGTGRLEAIYGEDLMLKRGVILRS